MISETSPLDHAAMATAVHGTRMAPGADTLPPQRPRVSRVGLVVSSLLLVALVVFVVTHLGEARRFARLLEQAQPRWLLGALALQLGTYLCAGLIWRTVVRASERSLPAIEAARLALEKLSVDHLMPSGGLSGNLVVLGAMRRLGLPASLATEAMFIDILAYYAAYAVATLIALLVLWIHHDVTPVVLGLVGAFSVVLIVVPLASHWLLRHRSWQPRGRLARVRALQRLREALRDVSPARVLAPRLLAVAFALNLTIFVLDGATVWTLVRATGTNIHVVTAFAALVMASIAGTISFLPGGVGSFEAACTATMAALGTPLEAALVGTLLFRGLSLWLPLAPGMLFARRDLRAPGSNDHKRKGVTP